MLWLIFKFGDPLHPIIKIGGIEYTLMSYRYKGFIVLDKPGCINTGNFCGKIFSLPIDTADPSLEL